MRLNLSFGEQEDIAWQALDGEPFCGVMKPNNITSSYMQPTVLLRDPRNRPDPERPARSRRHAFALTSGQRAGTSAPYCLIAGRQASPAHADGTKVATMVVAGQNRIVGTNHSAKHQSWPKSSIKRH